MTGEYVLALIVPILLHTLYDAGTATNAYMNSGKEEDELIGVELSDGSDEILLGTRMGQALRFNEKHVRAMGRSARGVRSMRLSEGDVVVDMAVIEEGGLVLTITENGYGKRTDPEEYRETARNGKGVRAMNITEKTGMLCAQLVVHEDEDLMIITDDGTMIRTPVSDIRVCGRATQGVRLMRIGENSRVVGVARASAEEDEAGEESPAPAETGEGGQDLDMDLSAPDYWYGDRRD